MSIAFGRAVILCLALGVDASAVKKVLEMLGDMKAKAIDEKNSELTTFSTFFQFCKDTTAARQQAIDENSAAIAKLSADVLKYGADIEALTTDVGDLDALVDKAKAEAAAAAAVRKTEQEDYEARHKELAESIEELEVGISQLQGMMRATDGSGAASLLQTAARVAARSRAGAQFASLLAARAQLVHGLAAPEAAAFESKSGGIVDMMDELLDKMKEEMDTLEKEEMQAKGSFDMMAQTLNDQIEQHSSAREFKSKTIKEKEAAANQAKGEQADATSSKAEDETYLGEVHMECATKSSDFEEEQKLRAGEIKALSKAIEIISGSAVSSADGKSVSGLLQTNVVVSLAQLRVNAVRSSQTAVAAFLRAQGDHTGSKILSFLALRASSDPFAKVKKMIEDMVYKLMEEANEEAEHKGFCDTEMGTNKVTRDQKGTEVEELSASIEEAGARAAALAQRIAALSDEVAALDAALREATTVRNAEKEKNGATVAEAKRASAAVAQALGVLQEFYSGAASSAALVQARGTTAAQAAKSQSGASAGVIGMLEVILSDFERLEATTKEAEDMSQSDFEQFVADSSKNKAVKSTNLKNLEDSRTQLEVETSHMQKDLESAQSELTAARDYFEKLKPSCVEAGVSYEDRVERRKEEIESLQDALKML